VFEVIEVKAESIEGLGLLMRKGTSSPTKDDTGIDIAVRGNAD